MNSSKTGWVFPIIVLITLIAVIWLGISQFKSRVYVGNVDYISIIIPS